MKKNIIFLVIDSLSYERVEREETTPFLKRLAREEISVEGMYSEAPFTEAALMGLICGQPTMDRGGYMMRYRDVPETFLETFSKAGYEVLQFLQPHIYPTSLERNLPHSYYNVGFDFAALWSYRLAYFAGLHDGGRLTEADYGELADMLADNFKGWTLFLRRVLEKDERVRFIAENLAQYDAAAILRQVKEERARFEAGPRAYLHKLFTEKSGHPLFAIPTLNQVDKVHDDDVKAWVRRTYGPLMEEVRRAQAAHGPGPGELFAALRGPMAEFFRHPSLETAKDPLRLVRYFRQRSQGRQVMERVAPDYDAYKAAPSMARHFELFFDWHDTVRDKTKPYLAYIHVDDVHNPEVFFSYDSRDREELAAEFEDVKNYLSTLKPGYRGSVTYDLALRYMDRKVERFVSRLRDQGFFEDTVLYITADHGFSFYDAPLRETAPNNFYKESYHVPFFIVGSGRPARPVAGFRNTFDIPATLLSEAGLQKPDFMAGRSVFEEARPYAMAEYMGGGCPDPLRRPIRYAIRNERWNAVYSALREEPFEKGRLVQLFDLVRDPEERHNLAHRAAARDPEVRELLAALRARHEELSHE